ncbi:MAG: hypothetical protein ABIO49_08035 [Dokdonella sp.]
MRMSAPFAVSTLLPILCLAFNCASAVSIAPAPKVLEPATTTTQPAVSVEKKGMTWGVGARLSDDKNIVYVSCQGQPRIDGHGCEAYVGDTACSSRRPLLCLNVDGRARPADVLVPPSGGVMPKAFYSGWAAGRIGLSKPVKGDQFKNRSDADAFCASNLGTGWRVAEHHDGIVDAQGSHGGWGLVANGHVRKTSRFWVAINDTAANCWDPSQ